VGIHDYEDDPAKLRARYHSEHVEHGGMPDVLLNGWPGGRVITLEDHPHRGQPIMLTEFGGIAQSANSQPGSGVWGYSTSDSGTDLGERYTSLLEAVHDIDAFAGFCYTQFTDTFQEANGLFLADRTPKFDLEQMRRATEGAQRRPTQVLLP
jgi:hypothetical protein